jgi:thiamine pyrophosphate-dependent acetolactate synthase large subunit-like protein
MQISEAIVRGLKDSGVEVAFGGNGESIASLTVTLERPTIRPILTRHEQAAAYMACRHEALSACGADGYSVDSLEAFSDALVPRRPTVIDAKFTRWARPHDSSPHGTLYGVWETLEERLRDG